VLPTFFDVLPKIPKLKINLNYQKQSIANVTLKVVAKGDLLVVIIALMLSVPLCPKLIILP
jgi:hypothetical protein